LELAGSQPGTDYSLSLDNGNHAWDLVINTQENVLLGCDLNVEHSLIHQQGVLDVTTNQYQIWIKGDWLSTATSDPFLERNGTVHLHGSASSVVNWGTATAGVYQLNVDKDSGATLTLQSITQVGGMLNVMSNATLHVDHNLSVSQMTSLEGQMHLANPITATFTGAFNCIPGSQLHVNDATCTLSGSSGLFMDGTMSLNGGLFDAKNRNLNIGTGGAIVFSGNGRIKCANFYADHSGNFTPSSGTLELGSTTTGINRNLRLGSGNYVHNLVINSAGQVNTLSSLPCHNDLQIMAGSVLNLAYDATVDGDLYLYGTCNLSPSVTLLLHGHPTIASGGVLNVNAGTFICDETPSREALSLDGTIQISSGVFELQNHYLSLSSTGLILQSGGTLKLNGLSTSHNGRYQPVGGSLELTSNLSATQRELSLPGDNYCFDLVIDTNATIMLGADLEIKGDLDILAGYLDASANDYDIDLYGSWNNATGDAVTGGFVCRAGSVRFIGSGNSDISYQGDRELFHNLVIAKTNAADLVKLLCPIATNTGGYAEVSKGIFSLNGFAFENSGSTDVMNGGTLLLEPGSTLATGADHILNIHSGGTMITRGSGRARSALKGKNAQPWKAKAHGGSYVRTGATDYQDLQETGFWVDANATVDPDSCFNHCSFSTGASGCTYLTFDNDQTLVIGYASFSGNGSQLYNIAKNSATGSITLNDASGNFAGPAHENDPHSRIFWSGYLPNLTISSIEISETDPYVADQISYTVYILNDSDNPSEGSFKVHHFKHRASATDLDELSELYQSLGNIAAHGTVNCTFSNIYSMDDANWTSWVSIDPEDAILETDEEDNLDDCSVTWHALPAVSDAEISATGSNTARLQWSFPIWCDRYKIWWDADPYGSFGNYLGSATDSFFDLTLSSDRRFYRVVAERDVPTP
ncbi:MAG: hypothetical protein U1B83_08375, partial [Candidatus Cloacimonadaceae bacterium]|nr:hypothetical protein [Candidatus Cloacimonadaceae bacterium]